MSFRLSTVIAVLAIVTGFAAIGATRADAAEFHCSVEPCRFTLKPDGELGTKTAHQVFILAGKNASGSEVVEQITCNQLAATAEAGRKTTIELLLNTLEYTECNLNGLPITIFETKGCSYLIKAAGKLSLECGSGSFRLTYDTPSAKCTITVPNQSLLSTIKYHDAGTEKKELTIEISILSGFTGVTATAGTEGGCEKTFGFTGALTKFQYTTGNAILTAETTSGVMANVWFE